MKIIISCCFVGLFCFWTGRETASVPPLICVEPSRFSEQQLTEYPIVLSIGLGIQHNENDLFEMSESDTEIIVRLKKINGFRPFWGVEATPYYTHVRVRKE